MPFSIDQDKFILEAYFRSGVRSEYGNWTYRMESCVTQFREQFPLADISYDTLSQHVRRIVTRFRKTGTVAKGKSPGRRPLLSDKAKGRAKSGGMKEEVTDTEQCESPTDDVKVEPLTLEELPFKSEVTSSSCEVDGVESLSLDKCSNSQTTVKEDLASIEAMKLEIKAEPADDVDIKPLIN